ncbi:hypothetical protein J1N35_000488 [Gossypium stocksii]|uniref:Uncharacterized protein n=1 Tax=Gossypium stocksii TaxID=47602 RepID=A0A9D3WHQ9_9ROSI|nr:hypothetical protein J1N35_000488 [Gossypium stocksii]
MDGTKGRDPARTPSGRPARRAISSVVERANEFFREPYGLMRRGDHIGIGTQRKLGRLLLGPYSRFISIPEQIQIWKV